MVAQTFLLTFFLDLEHAHFDYFFIRFVSLVRMLVDFVSQADAALYRNIVPGTPNGTPNNRELFGLNKRLENMIIKNRIKDQLVSQFQHAYDEAKQAHEKRLRDVRAKNKTELQSLRDENEKVANKNRLLMEEFEKAKSYQLEIIHTIQAENDKLKTIEEIMIQNESVARNEAGAVLKRINELRDAEQQRAAMERLELDRAQRNSESARIRLATVLTQVEQRKQENHDLKLQLSLPKVSRLKRSENHLNDFSKLQAHMDFDFHKFSDETAQMIHDVQRDNDSQNKLDLSELKVLYEQKINEYRNEVQHIGHEFSLAKEAERVQQDELAEIRALQAEKLQLESDIAHSKLENEDLAREKDRVLNEMKDDLTARDREFEVNVGPTFDARDVIQNMLDLFEPINKRRKVADGPKVIRQSLEEVVEDFKRVAQPNPKAVLAPVPESVGAQFNSSVQMEVDENLPDPESPETLAQGRDPYGLYFTIENASNTDFETMKGWKLVFQSSRQIFNFPDVKMAAGAQFQIRMCSKPPQGPALFMK
jgi:hypothetical protein